MLRFLAPALIGCVLVGNGTASAQPVAAQPPPEGAVAVSDAPWVPPPPRPNQVRGLPPCPPGTPPAEPGEQYTCRPEMAEPGVQMSLPIELSWGGLYAGTPLQHSAVSFAAGLDFALSRSAALGVGWRYLGGGEAVGDGDGDGQDDAETGYYSSHLVGAGPRLRLWTDETAREAWTLELDGGWSFVPSHSELAGPYARISVGRQIGMFVGQTGAAQAALVLTYLQGFGGAEDLRAVLFGLRLQPEWGVPLPLDVDEVPTPASFAYTIGIQGGMFGLQLGGEGGAGLVPSLGLAVGFPVTRAIEPRVLADVSWFGGMDDAPAPLGYGGLAGVRLRLSDLLPAFVDVMGGWQLITNHQPRAYDSGAVLDVAAGLYVVGCEGGAAFGARYRRGLLAANEEYETVVFFLEAVWGNRRGSLGGEPWPSGPGPIEWSCGGGYGAGRAATPPPPPAPPASAVAEVDANLPRVGGEIDLEASLPEARAEVEIDVEPVVVEVTLGLSLFGGAVRFEIAPSSLPLRQLRESGFVDVEIVGPPGALARAEAELRAALGPDGASVDGWARTATDRLDVRAIFTIWPPGSRPPAR